jgi:hypothetical protein
MSVFKSPKALLLRPPGDQNHPSSAWLKHIELKPEAHRYLIVIENPTAPDETSDEHSQDDGASTDSDSEPGGDHVS